MRISWIWGLCFFLFAGSLHAQEVVARLDIGRKDPKPNFVEYSPVDRGLVTMGPASRSSSRYFAIAKYSEDFKLEWKKNVFEQNGRKNVDFLTVIGPNILIFVSEFFPRQKIIKTYYSHFDLAGNVIAEDQILSIYPNQKEQKVELQYVLSPDKKALLAYKNLQNRKEAENILYYLFNDRGEVELNGEFQLKYPDNRLRITSLRVSNQGNIYALAKYYGQSWVVDDDNFQYMVFRKDVTTELETEFKIEVGRRFISDLAFKVDREENIYVAGFYSNRSNDQIAGTVLQKIAPDGRLIQDSTDPFQKNFLGYYLSQGQINRGRELRDFFVREKDGIILRSDGGVLLIAEKFYITNDPYRNQFGNYQDQTIYHFDDVILTSISPSGDIEWQAIVDKAQTSEDPSTLSYFNAVSPSGTYIFYETRPRRMGFNIYYSRIDIQGNVSGPMPLLPVYSGNNQFFPRLAIQTGNREALMLYVQGRGRTYSVLKLRFDD
ncbi:MAG: hypothetical protein AAF135_03095 [Bacteroidota bacterium]